MVWLWLFPTLIYGGWFVVLGCSILGDTDRGTYTLGSQLLALPVVALICSAVTLPFAIIFVAFCSTL